MPKERISYFDNARFMLIVLVVMGHSLAQLKTDAVSAQGIYVFIYSFHMPAFILVTGYLSRNFEWTRDNAQRTLRTLVAPVLLFEVVSQYVLRTYAGEDFAQINPFITQWLGWFLWAMIIWRVLTPVILSLRWPLAWAIGVSLLSPLYDWPSIMASTKVLGFLPFYVAGLLLAEKHFHLLSTLRIRIVSVLVLAAALWASFHWPSTVSTTVMLWKRNYSDSALDTLTGSLIVDRAILMAAGFIITAAFLSLITWSSHWFTAMGRRTLYCYLLHGFVLMVGLEVYGLIEYFPISLAGTMGLMGLAVILAIALLTAPVERVFKPVFEPSLRWILRGDGRIPTQSTTDAKVKP